MRILTLFLSNGKSLIAWKREAILSREILLYLQFLRDGAFDRVQIFSYDAGDRAFVAELAKDEPLYGRIDILAPPSGALSGAAAARWGVQGPFVHKQAIARSAALKTNQVSGCWAAIVAARITKRPLVLRMGYLLSRRFRKNGDRARAAIARSIEGIAFRAATRIIVTSQELADALAARKETAAKTVRLPTYVDVAAFEAKAEYRFNEALIWIGRMTPQKNPVNMLRACALAGRDLVIVGRGEMEAELRALAETLPITVTFAGMIPNEQLPAKLREHSVFILPSLHEGLPKALIEAMACGLVCIGTPIAGTTDLIRNGDTGYIAEGLDAEAIAAAIRRVFEERNAELGRRARAEVEQAFGLEGYANREAELFRAVAPSLGG